MVEKQHDFLNRFRHTTFDSCRDLLCVARLTTPIVRINQLKYILKTKPWLEFDKLQDDERFGEDEKYTFNLISQ